MSGYAKLPQDAPAVAPQLPPQQPMAAVLVYAPVAAAPTPLPAEYSLGSAGDSKSEWFNPLCGCFDDCESCICAWFCPCIQFGKNMEASGLGDFWECCLAFFCLQYWTGFAWILSFLKRSELRRGYGIVGSDCEDCCLHCCCLPCSLAQEAREIKSRGRLRQPCSALPSYMSVQVASPSVLCQPPASAAPVVAVAVQPLPPAKQFEPYN